MAVWSFPGRQYDVPYLPGVVASDDSHDTLERSSGRKRTKKSDEQEPQFYRRYPVFWRALA